MCSPQARPRLAAVTLTALLLAAAPALAQSHWTSAAHGACLAQASGQPEAGLERAKEWEALGGGAEARHCAAVAMVGLGRYTEAAYLLEELVNDRDVPDGSARAALLAEAGNAWILANQLERAIAAFSLALELAPQAVGLYVDRALAYALAGDYWAAVDDLNSAQVISPNNVDVLLFRATAYRYLEVYELALDDVARAIALDPDNAEAYLERGNLRRLTKDDDGARRDWLKVLELDPEGPSGEAARRNIERLDLGAD